ncbi:MAG: hypothetical protein KGJ76_02430 [Betaproteobacteria bacterium]|nr:hypothetical protein [Betaproteobacteria bacterium]
MMPTITTLSVQNPSASQADVQLVHAAVRADWRADHPLHHGGLHHPTQARLLGAVRILFGLFFLVNLLLHFNPVYAAQFIPDMLRTAQAMGQPAWLGQWVDQVLAVFQLVGPARALALMFGIETLLTLGLLTGLGFPALGWLGLVYELLLWSTIGGLGGPYVSGATDPGTAIVYALGFVVILLTRAWQGASWWQGQAKAPSRDALRLAFLLFGALWAFDAWWKWQPGFLGQMASFLGAAQAGQPGWIVSWIGLFVLVMRTIGPFAFAVLAALTESAVAISVLFAHRLPLKWLRIALVLGLLYSLMLWTTAEGFGGPYGPGFTGNKGDVLGTTNVYSIIFLFMLAILWRPRQGHVQNTHADAGWRE